MGATARVDLEAAVVQMAHMKPWLRGHGRLLLARSGASICAAWPGRSAGGEERQYLIAVPFDEGRADSLDRRQLVQRARLESRDRFQRAVVGDRVGRLTVAGAHAPFSQHV